MSLTMSALWFSSIALLFASLTQCVVLWSEKGSNQNVKFQIYSGALLIFLTISNNIENSYNQQFPIMLVSLVSFPLIAMETVKAKSSITKFSIMTVIFVSITGIALLFASYKRAFFTISGVIYLMFIASALRSNKKKRDSFKPEEQ